MTIGIKDSQKSNIPWNKGLTKEIDKRVAKGAKKNKGRIAWNKGLTKETDERVRKIGNAHWKGGSDVYWQIKSREAWEKYHGRKIPPGGLIHHKDRNKKNLNKKNLELIIAESEQVKDSQSKHAKWHVTLRRLKKRTREFLNKK